VEATPRRLSGRLKSLENPAVLGGEGAASMGFAEVSGSTVTILRVARFESRRN